MYFSHGSLVPHHFCLEGNILFHADCFIDKGHKTLSIMKQELFLLGKEGFRIRVRLCSKWNRLNWAIVSFSDGDGRVLVFHVDPVKGG
jgi:hypothetical protein